MLKEERERYDRECPPDLRTSKNCKRLETTLDVYAKAVKGDLYELRRIGPAQAIQSRAAKVADALNVLFSCDRDHALKILTTFEPFLFSVLLEMGSLIAFSYAFSRHRPSKMMPSAAAKVEAPRFQHSTSISKNAATSKKGRPRNEAIELYVAAYKLKHHCPPSISELKAAFSEVPQSTLYWYRSNVQADNVVPMRARSCQS
jgi:hypothetical protein